jgi:hypothetical protein
LESFGWESKIIKLWEYYFCVEAVVNSFKKERKMSEFPS